MNLTQITSLAGAHRRRKRVGRGGASGLGKTAGRGHKGQQARSGESTRGLREGGQTPLYRRLPKRGFSNAKFRVEYSVVNLDDLDRKFQDGDTVTFERLLEVRLVRDDRRPVKILGDGELSKRLTVEAHKFSEKAVEKIKAAGGEAKVVKFRPRRNRTAQEN